MQEFLDVDSCMRVSDKVQKYIKAKKKIMSVSSDMSKNIRVGRSEKSFFFIFIFFLKKS